MEQPRTLDAMRTQLGNEYQYIALTLDEGEVPHSQPSTVIDARGATPIIVREGALTRDALERFL